MKILHVIASMAPSKGGTTAAVRSTLDALRMEGHDCDIACTDEGNGGPVDARHLAVRNVHVFGVDCRFYSLSRRLGAWLAANVRHYDVVHVHGLFNYPALAGMRAARAAGIPYVVTMHGMAGRYGMSVKPWIKRLSWALLEKPLLNAASAVQATSRSEGADYRALGMRGPVAAIPIAIHADHALSLLDTVPVASNVPVCSFIGRLDPVKNVEGLIGALAQPDVAATGLRLQIIGDGPAAYRHQLQDLARNLGVADRVEWPGFLDPAAMRGALARTTIGALPSHSESFGMAALEMVAAGLPVVLGQNVAVADDLRSAGLAVVTPTDAPAIAAGMMQALENAQPGYREKARQFIQQHYAPDQVGMALSALYRQVAAGKTRP